MQQTEKYKLNLIEPTDPFLPDGLNQNTQKMEDAMIAHETEVAGALSTMDQRVTVLEGFHFACGRARTNFIETGFMPRLVILTPMGRGEIYTSLNLDGYTIGIEYHDNGFEIVSSASGIFFLAFG